MLMWRLIQCRVLVATGKWSLFTGSAVAKEHKEKNKESNFLIRLLDFIEKWANASFPTIHLCLPWCGARERRAEPEGGVSSATRIRPMRAANSGIVLPQLRPTVVLHLSEKVPLLIQSAQCLSSLVRVQTQACQLGNRRPPHCRFSCALPCCTQSLDSSHSIHQLPLWRWQEWTPSFGLVILVTLFKVSLRKPLRFPCPLSLKKA